jgi:hypothetical protein
VNKIILAILALAGLGLIVEFLKRGKKTPTATLETDDRIKTAAEEGPTQTGRYKVQQMLSKTQPSSKPNAEPQGQESAEVDDDTKLPDPFDEL